MVINMKKILKYIKNIFKDLDKTLLIVTIVLAIWGLLNIVTASSRESVVRYDKSLYHYFFMQALWISAAFIGGFLITLVPTKTYKYIGSFLFFIIVVVLTMTLFMGDAKRGSTNWFFGFQPSEFAKPISIVVLAMFFESNYRKIRINNWNRFKPISWAFILALIIPILVFLQKDLGTAIIIGSITIFLLSFSPILRKDKLILFGIGIFLVVSMASIMLLFDKGLSEEQLSRINNFKDPCEKYHDDGYQICNGYIAINYGGLFGVGLGNSKQKYSYIPDPHTDSVFAIIAEEFGLIWSTIIFILYAILLKRILYWASNASSISGKYICIGIAIYIFVHIFINLGGLFGIIPLTGVPLPFFTYGGSFTISLICSLAIVQRVCIDTKRQKIKI